jgi:membrane protease YdiL (CAAX protease family)
MSTRRGGALNSDPLVLPRIFKPFSSLAAAVVAAFVIKSLFPRVSLGATAVTYFAVTPWFIATIFRCRGAVFGKAWQIRIIRCGLIGVAVGTALYAVDLALHAAAFGALLIAWAPAPIELVLLGCASAVVETVVFQIGVQERLGGWLGVILATLLFTLVHLSPNPMFLVAGAAFALTQRYTGLPGSVIVAHFIYNGLISCVPPR